MIAIVNLGIGNFSNVKKAVKGIITNDPDKITKADKVILPGVGSFGYASKQLSEIKEALSEIISQDKPFLGICLGMQLLFEESEEGKGKGIGLLKGKVVKFKNVRIPHIGWNQVHVVIDNIPLFKGIKNNSFFYFVHSYYVQPKNQEIVKGFTEYCEFEFPSVVAKGTIFGVQFHPEKSSDNGLKLLNNFRRL